MEPIPAEHFLVQKMMKYIQKEAHTPFELPSFAHMSPHEFSQNKLGKKVTADHVIGLEEKRKSMDRERDRSYGVDPDDMYRVKDDL